jgi:uncharacterized oligopeptide transporter (OPT) family protein
MVTPSENPPSPYRGVPVEEPGDGPMYVPGTQERQLTVRAVLTGCVLGALVSGMNIYFGLKTGWAIGGSLISAILGFSFFTLFGAFMGAKGEENAFTPLETNIAQTAGSAAGSMTSAAGLLSAIPALHLLGVEGAIDIRLGYLELTLWAAAVAWLGIFYAVPLRRQMVLVERLRFPTGTATAATILAMFSSGADAVRKAKWLMGFAVLAASHTLLVHFVPQAGHPPLEEWIPIYLLTAPAAYSFSLLVSPLMFGAGILIGIRVGASLLLGAILAWGVCAPLVEQWGWVEDPSATMSYATGARGWILWPGVAIMVADALTSLALSWRTILATFTGSSAEGEVEIEDPAEAIPNSWWMGGLGVASLLTIGATWMLFDISPLLSILAIALSSVLSAIAVRSTGETDINPTGGMGKVTQLVYGALAPGQMTTNLMTAGISSAGASQAGDMMQDLKTGWLLGASPRKQLIAQLCGVTVGIFTCVPVYLLFLDKIGTEDFPAPAAMAWKSMAQVLAQGFDALPQNAVPAVIAGLIFGAVMPLLRKATDFAYLPSGLAVGIAFIVPAYYSVAMFIGAVGLLIWQRSAPESSAALAFSVASGLIAGEGLMGVVVAIGEVFGVL